MNKVIGDSHHYYAKGDPVPQLVRVQGGLVWLPDNGKLVEVAKLDGRLVRLVEVTEGEGANGEL